MKMDALQQVREAWAGLPYLVKARAGAVAAVFNVGEPSDYAFVGSDGAYGWSCAVVPNGLSVLIRSRAAGMLLVVTVYNEEGQAITASIGEDMFETTTIGTEWGPRQAALWNQVWAVLGYRMPFPVPVKC
jgi:hypothetical protein